MSEMTAAISPPFNAGAKATRPPSETTSHRRVKTRDVASRYLDTTSSFSSSSLFQSSPLKRCQSPTVTRTNRPATPSAAINRPQSSGRRQSVTPRRDSLDRRGSGGEEVSAAERLLLTSGRGLFASFQADSFTGHENKSKLYSSPRTWTTSVGSQQEKSKLSEQWPRSMKPRHCLSRSVDFTDTMKKPSGSCNGVARALQSSMANNRPVSHGRTMSDSTIIGSFSTESVSCGRRRNSPASGIVVKARFSQQHQFLEPCSPVAKCNGTRKLSVDNSPKLFQKREQIRDASPGKFGMALASSSPRGSSIARGISPSRGVIGRMTSPLRVRSTTPLALSFAKKERIGENSVAGDAHLLRLFHNRLLQWRFANARVNAAISAQKMRAEVSNLLRTLVIDYNNKLVDGFGFAEKTLQCMDKHLEAV
uniref:QWRF motif-containing protein 9 n=1 Tax=Noccaea caerulescens TaxID=107243 RepID=A0A1J3GDX7_NOCCA